MKRALLLVLVASLSGCERDLPRLHAVHRDNLRREAELKALITAQETQLERRRTTANTEKNRSSRAVSDLRELQVELVKRWRGEADQLAALKKKTAHLPPALEAALDLAQASAGGEAPERRFVHAVESNDLATLAKLLTWWENDWADELEGVQPPEAPPNTCPEPQGRLSCTRLDDDAAWCIDGETHLGWALLLRGGQVEALRLQGGSLHKVEARLAPRVWMTQVGEGDRALWMLHELKASNFYTQWQEHLDTPAGRLESFKFDFDGDGWVELLAWRGNELTWVDTLSEQEVSVSSGLTACARISDFEKVPAPVRALCQRLDVPEVRADAGP